MNPISSERLLIPVNDELISVLLEEQRDPSPYKFFAVLNGWDERCIFGTGKTVDEAMSELADMVGIDLPADWRQYGSSGRLRSVEDTGATVAA